MRTLQDFIIQLDKDFKFWRVKERLGGILFIVGEPINIDKIYKFHLGKPAGIVIHFKTVNWFERLFLKNRRWMNKF